MAAYSQVKVACEEAAESALAALRVDPSLAARYWPLEPHAKNWWLSRKEWGSCGVGADGFSIPSQDLWAGYADSADEYLETGRDHFQAIMQSTRSLGCELSQSTRVLDFGCAAGRITRCFKTDANQPHVWGVDISARHVAWCRQHLSPPFRFLTSTTLPHLPFEDHFFDFIYSSSVFTHIGDLEDSWLMELRRIMKPGGYLFVSLHDEHTITALRDAHPDSWMGSSRLAKDLWKYDSETGVLAQPFAEFLVSREPGNTQVFHHSEHVKRHWGMLLDFAAMHPNCLDYQTGYIFRKPSL